MPTEIERPRYADTSRWTASPSPAAVVGVDHALRRRIEVACGGGHAGEDGALAAKSSRARR
jgi:hypothetical protein